MIDLDPVGQTALGVAYLRAYESHRDDAVFVDPLAAGMYGAMVTDADGHLVALPTAGDRASRDRRAMYQWIVARTAFLDDMCRIAARTGVRQFVILGSGLDARPVRLDMGPAALWYELDRDQVIEVKEALLVEHDLHALGTRHAVRADLSGDWLAALESAGFDATVPTCWLAEGLVMYLDAATVHRIVATVTEVSAPGSRLGLTLRSRRTALADGTFAHISALWHDDPGVVDDLTAAGWECTFGDAQAVLAAHGRVLTATTDGCDVASTGASLVAATYGASRVGVGD